jgi:hypothetical protein
MSKMRMITAGGNKKVAVVRDDQCIYYTYDNSQNNIIPLLTELLGQLKTEEVSVQEFNTLLGYYDTEIVYHSITPPPMFDFSFNFNKRKEDVKSELWDSTIHKANEIVSELATSHTGIKEMLAVLGADIRVKETATGFSLYLTSAFDGDGAIIDEAYYDKINRRVDIVIPFTEECKIGLTDYLWRTSEIVGWIGEYAKNKAMGVSNSQSKADMDNLNQKISALHNAKPNSELLFYDLMPYLDTFNSAYPTVDKDERGDFSFHLTRFGKCIAEYDNLAVADLIDSGFMRFGKDYAGLAEATGININPSEADYYTRLGKATGLYSVDKTEKFEQFMITHITGYLKEHPELCAGTTGAPKFKP